MFWKCRLSYYNIVSPVWSEAHASARKQELMQNQTPRTECGVSGWLSLILWCFDSSTTTWGLLLWTLASSLGWLEREILSLSMFSRSRLVCLEFGAALLRLRLQVIFAVQECCGYCIQVYFQLQLSSVSTSWHITLEDSVWCRISCDPVWRPQMLGTCCCNLQRRGWLSCAWMCDVPFPFLWTKSLHGMQAQRWTVASGNIMQQIQCTLNTQ